MQILAVQVDRPFLRIAILEVIRGKVEIISLKSPLLEEPETVKRLYMPSFKGKIVSGISEKNLFTRLSEIKTVSPRHLEQAFAFQIESMNHLSSSDTLIASSILKQDKEKTEGLIFAVSKEVMRDHLELLDTLAIDPGLVTATSLGLVRYFRFRMPLLQDAFIVDIGSEEWTCVSMEQGVIKKTHAIEQGVESLYGALWEDRKKMVPLKEIRALAKQVDVTQLHPHNHSHLIQRLQEMRRNLTKVLFSFHRESGPKPLFFTGRIDAFSRMKEYWLEGVCDFVDRNQELEIPSAEQKYAIAIGLGLSYEKGALQFRKGEFVSQKSLRRLGIYATTLFSLSFLFALALIFLGTWQTAVKEEEKVLFLSRSLESYDPNIKKELFQKENAKEILESWNRMVRIHDKEYPYILTVPNVSEFLQWFNHFPLLTRLKEDSDPLEIHRIDYKLVSFPSLQSGKDPYKARVEIEFTTKNTFNARQFHEALLQETTWIDGEHEITWEAGDRHKYRVSFFLSSKGKHNVL